MCLLTVRLSGLESKTRPGLKPNPALSWFLAMLVTCEKKKVGFACFQDWGGKHGFTYCPLPFIPRNLLLFSLFSTSSKNQWILLLFFLTPMRIICFFQQYQGTLTHPGHPKLTPGFVGSVILLSFLFLLFQQVPTASVTIEGASALNRVRWAQAGKEVAVGDSEGRIWVYDVGEVSSVGILLWFVCFVGVLCFVSKVSSWRLPHPSWRKKSILLFQWSPHWISVANSVLIVKLPCKRVNLFKSHERSLF